MTEYTVDYFIEKFRKAERWTTRVYADDFGACCALGHCGVRQNEDIDAPCHSTEEGTALAILFADNGLFVAMINDGFTDKFTQPNAKERIIAALEWIKSK